MNEITERWARVGCGGFHLLSAIPEEFWDDTAAALENQRIHNECLLDTGRLAMMKRISIPVVVRMMSQLRGKVKSRLQYTAKVMRTNVKGPWWCDLEDRFHPRFDMNEEIRKTAELAEKLVAIVEAALPTCKGEFLLLGITADDDGTVAIFYDVAPKTEL